MIDWPTLEALKRELDLDSDAYDEELENALAAGIARVKAEAGSWDDYTDFPTENQANAALRAAILLRPNADPGIDPGADPVYRGYMFGQRGGFGVS